MSTVFCIGRRNRHETTMTFSASSQDKASTNDVSIVTIKHINDEGIPYDARSSRTSERITVLDRQPLVAGSTSV